MSQSPAAACRCVCAIMLLALMLVGIDGTTISVYTAPEEIANGGGSEAHYTQRYTCVDIS